MAISPIAAAAVSGGIDALGGGLNALANANQSRLAYNRTVRLWEMEKAYNDPSAQMERLKQAGLNPNLIYGTGVQGATGNTHSPSSPQPARMDFGMNGQGVLQTYNDSQMRQAQVDNIRAQTEEVHSRIAIQFYEQLLKDLEFNKGVWSVSAPPSESFELDGSKGIHDNVHENSPFVKEFYSQLQAIQASTRQRQVETNINSTYGAREAQQRIANMSAQEKSIMTETLLKSIEAELRRKYGNIKEITAIANDILRSISSIIGLF